MSKHSDLVMVCDACGVREVLQSNPPTQEIRSNEAVRSRIARWHPLSTRGMGGETEWDLCPDCFAEFIAQFTKGSK